MSSYLSRLNPVPGFPQYTGPYKVGTIDVEIPVTDLESPSPAPTNAAGIHTIQYRIFYPARPDSQEKYISWLPQPQRSYLAGYTQFLGLGSFVSELASFIPRHLHYTTIPAHKNATLLDPDTPSAQWPVMVFSHGLGGNRNAYSHIAGSVASHGVVVVCPEHRDGSSVLTLVRDPAAQDSFLKKNRRSPVYFRRIPHTENPEVWEKRNEQLRIRLWELGLLHEAILKTNEGAKMTNLNVSTPAAAFEQFKGQLDVEEPGKMIWAGHSFGCATLVQFFKSNFYADRDTVKAIKDPLFKPSLDCRLRRQITAQSPLILLDMWCFPLLEQSMRPLWELPLPAYAKVSDAPGGAGFLAIESEAFYKWTRHLHTTAKAFSPNPTANIVSAESYQTISGARRPEPNFYYVEQSAHVNQSDFGILFPWACKKIFNAVEPERVLRLNLRAILQLLRSRGVPVAKTSVNNLVDGPVHSDQSEASADDDAAILTRASDTKVQNWKWVNIEGLGDQAADKLQDENKDEKVAELRDEEERMGADIEPTMSSESAEETVKAMASPAL